MRKVPSCSVLSFFNFNTNCIQQKSFFLGQKGLCDVIPSKSSLQLHSHVNLDSLVSTLIVALNSCSRVSYCQAFHARVIKSVNYRHGFVGDQLVTNYAKLGYPDDAQTLFDEMPNKDLVSWNSLISGLSRSGFTARCLSAFCRMRFEIDMQPNYVTFLSIISACSDKGALSEGKCIHGFAIKLGVLNEVKIMNALINMYGKSGYLHEACWLFEAMPLQNLVSWNSMIAIYTQNGLAEESMGIFIMTRRALVEFDQATMLTVLQACENLGVRNLAGSIHGLILRFGLIANVAIATALLDLYAKLGCLHSSSKVFGEIIYLDRVAWTAMLAGYAMHGYGKDAIKLFEVMVKKGIQPDHVTFTHLLSACSHSGLVKEGKHYFKLMSEVYGVEHKLDHYSCMVDLLGRSGLLSDAYDLIKRMPMEPNTGVWGALLGACRVYVNTELGKEAAERLVSLDPSDIRNYIMLSNIYSAAGLWREASKVRALIKERSLNRKPGCSFVEHGNKIHRFVVGDRSHPEADRIYHKLEELIGKIRKAGFMSKTEFVLHDVDEEVKENMINEHSEKLAMAFGLLVTDVAQPLIITKNLRICGDCHSTAKVASLIEKRTIIIRDPKRFHHFSGGICSCGDYW
ncbi:pentatricopeptide repeat-containing protein At5g40410, mitochondrial [Durio zibethinus]|uniref:Pentatricopeptide repeat-containing protein At5g40410, mitochondrial n=1 Tax=Durio zibethinus TaxID=66656 RepID=A0A6P5ZGS5_DURZI|nr:pentatricopeptide repeat-containing protein At5g40410, mitochondrial [Durio zibethinus]